MNIKYYLSIVVISLLTHPQASLASTANYFDGTFVDTDWTHTVIWDETPGGGSFSADQALSGGNPAEYQHGSHTYGPGNVVYGHIYSGGGSYDPSIQGAINNINFSHDFIVLSRRFPGSDEVSTKLLVEQGGRFFYASDPFTFTFGNPWTSASASLTNADFLEITSTGPVVGMPDFSATGSLIQFGYASTNFTGYSGNTNSWGMDNFQISVNSVPIPAAAWLFGSGLIGLVGLARRKKA